MKRALELAQLAAASDEVPIGCVIVHDPTDAIVGEGYNRRRLDHDPTGHAEMLAIRQAGKTLGDWRLCDCTLYVTLEPCPMCAGAIVNARIPRIVYGAADFKAGACATLYQLTADPRLNHQAHCTGGLLAEESARLLREFFQAQRRLGKK